MKLVKNYKAKDGRRVNTPVDSFSFDPEAAQHKFFQCRSEMQHSKPYWRYNPVFNKIRQNLFLIKIEG